MTQYTPNATLPTADKIRAYLTVKQVADRYSASVPTIWRWARNRDDFPNPVKLGDNCTRFRLADLEQWEAEREVA